VEGPGKLNIKTYLDNIMQNILGYGFDMGHADVQILLKKKGGSISSHNLQHNLHKPTKRRLRT